GGVTVNSNFDVKEFEAAQAAMKSSSIVSNQVEYSMIVRYVEKELLAFCQKNSITIIAYSPLARGAIFSERYKGLTGLLGKIAANHSKSIAQVALNWLIEKKGVVAIPKATDEKHVIDNAGASGWKLTKKEQDEIGTFLLRINKQCALHVVLLSRSHLKRSS
ncbi:MAG: aldo/keto reductase, partial [Nitrospirota bacterium]